MSIFSRTARGPVGTGTSVPTGPLASIRDLNVSFTRGGETVNALRGVSLEIRRGEILGLVGESGSGKSVLGMTLLGLHPTHPAPTITGVAEVAGTDMVAATSEQAREMRRVHLGAVFQDPMTSLNPTMRVGHQVVEAAGSKAEAIRLLDAVGIPDPARRFKAYPHELSGGLRQRVMIAMAIAGNPSLVIADEPTTALDVTVQAQILDLLGTLRAELGTSFLLVTHDLGVAAQVADRIAVLYGGRLAEIGGSDALFQDPLHPYARGLLRSRLLLTTDRTRPVMTLPGEPPDPRNHPQGCAFGPRCEFHTEACDVALPELETVGNDGRQVACVHIDDLPKEDVIEQLEQASPWPPVTRKAGAPRPAVLAYDVKKSFTVGSGFSKHQLQALLGVDLMLNEGESLALAGESGCGKSTLLRSIGGLQGIDSGQIDLGRGARPQMVFQDAGASLTPWLTVGEQIGERLRAEGLKRDERALKVREALTMVGLSAEVAEARPRQLSGGQRQRVALARATVVPPEVLLCDEPTSALDVSLAATVLNLIGRLRRELGVAIIFVTHDLAAARMVGDRIAVMYLGRIVEIGNSEDLCAHPLHPYTTALLETVPQVGRVHQPLKGEPANPLELPTGCPFHPRCPVAEASCATGDYALVPVAGSASRSVACPVALRTTAKSATTKEAPDGNL